MKIKTIKRTGLVFILLGVILAMPLINSSVFAQTSPFPTRAAYREQRIENRMGFKTERANQEIDRRVAVLNGLITRINNMKRPTADQKAALVSEVQTEINNLLNLKAKIAADTDLATLTADKRSIISEYRIYMIIVPKITLMAHADATLQTAQTMQSKNPTGDAATKIVNAITQATQAYDIMITFVKPSDYSGNNKTAFQNARVALQGARKDLNSAWSLMK